MKKLILFCHALFWFASVAGQKEARLHGIVVDEGDRPVEYATVSLLALPDSSLVTGAVTDTAGSFSLMYGLKPGDYLLRVSHVSYETASQTYRPEGTSAPIRVRLKASAIGLGEVTVRGSFVEQRFDRYLVRLKGNSLTEAKNTMETLALMPGVTELGGSLQVNGQSISEVYLNNRKLTDLSELENLPASYIDRIEILPEIRNRHDGTQKGGVIYIHMRRNPEAGGFGSVRVDAAIRQAKGNSQSIGVPFSYRVGKMNFYNNLYLGHYRSPYRTEFERQDEQGERLLTGYRGEAQRAYRLNEVFCAVWEASPAHSLGINLTFQGKTSDTEASSVSNEAATTGEWIASTYDNQGDKSATRYQAGLDHLYKPGEGRIQSLHTVAEYLRQNEGNEERIADTTAHLNHLDDRLNLRCDLYNLFYRNRLLTTVTSDGLCLKEDNVTPYRGVRFSITYKFNMGKKVNVKRVNSIQSVHDAVLKKN